MDKLVKHGRGGKYNFPTAIDPDTEDPNDIRDVLTETLKWYDRGQDRPNTDDGILDRSREYFTSCINRGVRPTVEAYCLALGYARQTVHQWKTGVGCSTRRTDIIKKAYDAFAAFDAGMATNGKLNPVLYFFRAKNYYDMRDQQELVISPNSPLQTDTSPIDIANKYNALPED